MLAKLGGSVRFEGEIQPRRAGFAFHGRMFCPWGDCTQDLDGSFVARGEHYVGSFTDDHMTVELERASGGYGGDSYGGDRYGGASYGNLGPSGRPRNPPP